MSNDLHLNRPFNVPVAGTIVCSNIDYDVVDRQLHHLAAVKGKVNIL